MWKMFVIYLSRYSILEGSELKLRDDMSMCEYNPFVMYAFLYNEKGSLQETYINSQTSRDNRK